MKSNVSCNVVVRFGGIHNRFHNFSTFEHIAATRGTKPAKPYPDFPLTAHPSGSWVKKIKKKLYYFGPWSNPEAALAKYVEQRDDLQADRVPRITTGATTVAECVNAFLAEKDSQVQSGELAPRSFDVYRRGGKNLVEFFGRNREVSDLRVEDFQHLRKHLSQGKDKTGQPVQRGLVALANEIRVTKVILHWFNSNLEDRKQSEDTNDTPVWIPKAFSSPKKKNITRERNEKPKRMLEAVQLRSILALAGTQLRAMCLLAINAGYGQTDLSLLPETAVDLQGGWIVFPRPKTHVHRQAPLWPETIAALKLAIDKRPTAKCPEAEGKVFVTKYGSLFVRSIVHEAELASAEKLTQVDSVALEFGKLLTKLGLKRKGLNFYAIRHTFQTIAGESTDAVCVQFLMGHSPSSSDMGAVYRETISDERLKSTTDVVRKWLWPAGSEAKQIKADQKAAKRVAVVRAKAVAKL